MSEMECKAGFGTNVMRIAATFGLALAISSCQSAGNGLGMSKTENENADLERISFEELRGYCPQVLLREGTAYFNTYDGEETRDNVRYQASISDVTRKCDYANGQITMTVAVTGRVLLGPKGAGGTVQLPIRVAALQGETVLYSEVKPYTVEVTPTGATQFVYTDAAVNVGQPTSRNIILYAGFDEGPKNAAATN